MVRTSGFQPDDRGSTPRRAVLEKVSERSELTYSYPLPKLRAEGEGRRRAIYFNIYVRQILS